MPAAAWVTLLATALIVGYLAINLLRVIVDLKHVTWTLGAIIVGVRAIAYQTRNVSVVIPNVNKNLAPVRAMAEQV
jgi:hypothetical protein